MPTKRTKPTGQSTANLDDEVADYLMARSARERAESREGTYKGRFMQMLAELGELQEGGHRILKLNEPVLYSQYKNGVPKNRDIAAIRSMKRTTQTLNVERALSSLMKWGMYDQCTRTEVVLDEDAILAAAFTGQISDDDMKTLYDEKESYAFYLVDADEDPNKEQ